MEDQILKLLKKNYYPLGELDDDVTCAREIASHVRSFINWKDKNLYMNKVFNEKTQRFITLYTLAEIYDYWLTDVCNNEI